MYLYLLPTSYNVQVPVPLYISYTNVVPAACIINFLRRIRFIRTTTRDTEDERIFTRYTYVYLMRSRSYFVNNVRVLTIKQVYWDQNTSYTKALR